MPLSAEADIQYSIIIGLVKSCALRAFTIVDRPLAGCGDGPGRGQPGQHRHNKSLEVQLADPDRKPTDRYADPDLAG